MEGYAERVFTFCQVCFDFSNRSSLHIYEPQVRYAGAGSMEKQLNVIRCGVGRQHHAQLRRVPILDRCDSMGQMEGVLRAIFIIGQTRHHLLRTPADIARRGYLVCF